MTLALVDHPPETPHRDPRLEESEDYAVCWVESGSFGVRRGKEAWRLSHGALFVTGPGLRYRCSHESETPDDVCLSLHCPEDLVQEEACSRGRRWEEVMPVAPLTGRLAYLRRQLLQAVTDGVAPMAIPSLASHVVAAVLGSDGAAQPHRPSQLSWYAERVDAARHVMESRFADPLSIEQLCREVGISASHFSRVFHELAGIPPHRYLVKVRLARAAEALHEGASVTQAGLSCGFPSLSQFIRQFRRAYGVTPSRYSGSSKIAEKSKPSDSRGG